MGSIFAIMLSAAISLFPSGEGPAPDPGEADLSAFVSLNRGDHGPLVEHLQVRLTNSGFRPGEIDGIFARDTYQAVLAFEKLHGLERDGVFKPEDWDLLGAPTSVRARSEADRIEIDLKAQVLYVVKDNAVEAVVGISSGNGGTYTNSVGRTSIAKTPEGRYSFYLERNYNHRSYLGTMYKPYYFYGGYAIH
ncbi:MAG: L,D-transpeptidase family protein, partial [Acidimicrobiia bacterium]|nr:L,D-transpeptidase family protein [Acidimicrobiia bacterium]